MSEGQIRIGVGGWTYPPWRGSFIRTSCRRRKSSNMRRGRWARSRSTRPSTGGRSRKAGKRGKNRLGRLPVRDQGLALLRHALAPLRGCRGLGNFFAQGLGALGPKLGPILWQFAPRRKFDRDDIAGFIDLLPEALDGVPLRHAIEPRHESFGDEKFFELCRARNIAVVFAEFRRLSMHRKRHRESSSMRGFNACAKRSKAATAVRRSTASPSAHAIGAIAATSTFFMINGAKVRAPAAALALQERLR